MASEAQVKAEMKFQEDHPLLVTETVLTVVTLNSMILNLKPLLKTYLK